MKISPDDADAGTEGHQVDLDADGTTEITVTVGYLDDMFANQSDTYTVTLTQLEGTVSPLSDNVELSSVSFSRLKRNSITVTATNDHHATITFGSPDANPDTPGHQEARWALRVLGDQWPIINLRDGTIKVTVTSQDGAVRRTYSVLPWVYYTEKEYLAGTG